MGNVFKSDQEQASHPSDLPKEVIAESNVGLVELLIQQEELTAKITIEDIILGVGSFGEIRSAILHAEDRPCAVKLIDKTKLNENMTKNLQREVSIWRTLHHENILELICVFETNEEVVLCMPKAENGDLFSLLEKTQYIGWESEEVPKNIFRQVVRGVEYLHTQGIVHRDIKPENILRFGEITTENPRYGDGPNVTLKIGDFGFACSCTENSENRSFTGTLEYSAPELLDSSKTRAITQSNMYTLASDIWSLGVLLYILLSGSQPFFIETQTDLLKIQQGAYEPMSGVCWEGISSEAIDLVQQILTVDVEKRPTASDILQHPWFS